MQKQCVVRQWTILNIYGKTRFKPFFRNCKYAFQILTQIVCVQNTYRFVVLKMDLNESERDKYVPFLVCYSSLSLSFKSNIGVSRSGMFFVHTIFVWNIQREHYIKRCQKKKNCERNKLWSWMNASEINQNQSWSWLYKKKWNKNNRQLITCM